jgi:photosystem II stability/assembly factor-like uncharacterized protein
MQRRHFLAIVTACLAAKATAKEEPIKPTRNFYSIWGSAKHVFLVGYASGAVGLILHSQDQGKTWRQPKSNTTQELYGIWGSSENNIYIVGARGTILRSVDKGKTWERQQSNTKMALYGVFGVSATKDTIQRHLGVFGVSAKEIYVVGEAGTIVRTKDSGKTWEELTSNTAQTLSTIWGASAKNLYAAGLRGTLLRSIDEGKTWEAQTTPAKEKLCAIYQAKASDLLLVENESVLQSIDGGKTWKKNPATEKLFGLFVLSENQWFVAGAKGVLYFSADQGATFSTIDSGLYSNLRDLWGDGFELYAISELGGISYSKDAGKTWAVQLKEAFKGGH